MRTLLLSLVVSGLGASAAGSQPPTALHRFLRTWDLGRDGEGEDTCTVTLRADPAIGGYGVSRRRNCRAVPGGDTLYAWRPIPEGGVAFSDAERHTVHAFTPDTGYAPRGWGFESRDSAGRLWVMNVHGRPPSPELRR